MGCAIEAVAVEVLKVTVAPEVSLAVAAAVAAAVVEALVIAAVVVVVATAAAEAVAVATAVDCRRQKCALVSTKLSIATERPNTAQFPMEPEPTGVGT